MNKEKAKLLISENDFICDPEAKLDFCKTIGITQDYFDKVVDRHANKKILYKDAAGRWRRKEEWFNQ